MPPIGQKIQRHSGRPRLARFIVFVAFVFLAVGVVGVVFVLPNKVITPTKNPQSPGPQISNLKAGNENRPSIAAINSTSSSDDPLTKNPDLPITPQASGTRRTTTFPPPILTPDPVVTPSQQVLPTDTTPSPVLVDVGKLEAERLLSEALRKQARLENTGVNIWGKMPLKTSYPEVLAVLAKANEHFDKREFQPAISGFRTAITSLDELAASRDERFRRAMATGAARLLNNNSDDAVDRYDAEP